MAPTELNDADDGHLQCPFCAAYEVDASTWLVCASTRACARPAGPAGTRTSAAAPTGAVVAGRRVITPRTIRLTRHRRLRPRRHAGRLRRGPGRAVPRARRARASVSSATPLARRVRPPRHLASTTTWRLRHRASAQPFPGVVELVARLDRWAVCSNKHAESGRAELARLGLDARRWRCSPRPSTVPSASARCSTPSASGRRRGVRRVTPPTTTSGAAEVGVRVRAGGMEPRARRHAALADVVLERPV